jgi:hypothetical protein
MKNILAKSNSLFNDLVNINNDRTLRPEYLMNLYEIMPYLTVS